MLQQPWLQIALVITLYFLGAYLTYRLLIRPDLKHMKTSDERSMHAVRFLHIPMFWLIVLPVMGACWLYMKAAEKPVA